jgi:hypothetical protein
MIFPWNASRLNQAQLKWLAQLFTDLGKATFALGVLGFFIPSLDIPVNPAKFSLSLIFTLTLFYFAGRILTEVKTS